MTDFENKPPRSDDPSNNRVSHTSTSSSTNHANTTRHSHTKNSANWVWLIPVVLLTLGVGLYAGKLWGEKQADSQVLGDERTSASNVAAVEGDTDAVQKPVLTVETVKPKQSVVGNTLSADGTIRPETIAAVNGKVSGVSIENVLVNEGDYVKQGQVLAVFDTDAMQQRLTQAQAELSEARTSYELARRNAERVQPLIKMQAISQQEADRYAATANQTAAAVAASEARLNSQKINLQNSQVTAPVSGIISEKNANIGSVPGPQPLFTIIENGQLEWQAKVDPEALGEITIGTPVTVDLPNSQNVAGQVARIAPTAEDGSRQVMVYTTLANHPSARAGMYQRGVFELGRESKVTIPVSAVVTQDGYDYVMQVKAVKNDNGDTIHRISRVKVNLGKRIGDQVLLLGPLKGEGNIVRQGGSFLNDGDIVRVANNLKGS